MKKNSIDMELTLEATGETLQLTNGSLYIGNEYDTSKVSVFLEDISKVQNKELIERLGELQKMVTEAHTEIKRMAVEAYKNEWMVQGALDEVDVAFHDTKLNEEETERVA